MKKTTLPSPYATHVAPSLEVRPWIADAAHFDATRAAVVARARLLPYLYTALRAAHDEGLGLLRPMYFEHPEEPLAYLQSLGLPQYYLSAPRVF